MKIIYSDHPIPSEITKSLFLAGPSPREKSVVDWRIEAVSLLNAMNFEGEVFIPIPEARFAGGEDQADWTYDNQVEWECKARNVADQILFWIPRDIKNGMPGFTTNIEFGEDLGSGKIVYGRPPAAEKCRYLDRRIEGLGLVVHDTLESVLACAIGTLGNGALRCQGEVNVPLFIWNTTSFQVWYNTLKRAGNRLDGAQLLHHFRLPNGKVLSFNLAVNIWIAAERRHKSNEFIISRPDISVVVAYYQENVNVPRKQVVLIKEFRSTVNNPGGYVYELPGGSAVENPDDGLTGLVNAQHELHEEAGILIDDMRRFEYVGQKQLTATQSTHRAQVYRVALTQAEYESLARSAAEGHEFGVEGDGERTSVHVVDLIDLDRYALDFSMIGIIHTALK